MTEASRQAISILRSPDHFQWYLIPFLALILYVYVSEAQKGHWHAVLTGLIFAAAEFAWEILNALVLHFTRYSALWTTPGDTAYLIMAGLNIEIYMMFSLAGLVLAKSLPADPAQRIMELPSRIVIPLAWGIFCLIVEIILNKWGALVWTYKYWSVPHVYFILVAYAAPFFIMTYMHDRMPLKVKIATFWIFVCFDLVLWVIFAVWLRWI